MHLQQALLALGLVSGSVAVDFKFWYQGSCSGGHITCTNLGPNKCCWIIDGVRFPSFSVEAIPTNWNLNIRGHGPRRCDRTIDTSTSRGRKTVCMKAKGPYSGGGYSFASRKRYSPETREVDADVCPAGAQDTGECYESVEPDEIAFPDGTQYTLHDMTSKQREELTLSLFAGDSRGPAGFDLYIIK